MKLEQTECSETSAYKIQTPGSYPEESIQHSEHGEILKSNLLITSPDYVETTFGVCSRYCRVL
jgi:hypothetical protein